MESDIELRTQSHGEEIANGVIHGVGLLGSIAAIPLVVLASRGPRDTWQIVGGVIFASTLVLLYLASTLYHSLRAGRAKDVFRVIDHSAIYLLIAGTYTPFMLGPLRGPWGWTLLSIIWALALVGIAGKVMVGFRFPALSVVLYLGMGWLILIAIRPLIASISPAGIAWLVAGGVCYTGGVVFYLTDRRIRYGHALWHVFVLAGSTCHFFAVLWHAGGRRG